MSNETIRRRRFQFRLRTLMIGVTLLAIACWGAVDRARLIRERDDAVQKQQQALRKQQELETTNAELQDKTARFGILLEQLEARTKSAEPTASQK
jgi:hypothetical protein